MKLNEWFKRFKKEPYRFNFTEMTWRLVHAAQIDAQTNNSFSDQNLKDLEFVHDYLMIISASRNYNHDVKKSIENIDKIYKKWTEDGIVDFDMIAATKDHLERLM